VVKDKERSDAATMLKATMFDDAMLKFLFESTELPGHSTAGLYSSQMNLLPSSLFGTVSRTTPWHCNDEHKDQDMEPVNLARSKGRANNMSRFANVQPPSRHGSVNGCTADSAYTPDSTPDLTP
jgi:hypothetical protein